VYIPNVQIRTFYVKAFESYRLTDRQSSDTNGIIYHTASRVAWSIIFTLDCSSDFLDFSERVFQNPREPLPL